MRERSRRISATNSAIAALARPASSGTSPSAARSSPSQYGTPSRATNARITPIVLSPIARAGTLITRSKLTESASERRTRRYASASLTSRRE